MKPFLFSLLAVCAGTTCLAAEKAAGLPCSSPEVQGIASSAVLAFVDDADKKPGDAVDPVGTWKCEYEIGGQKRESTLTIKKEGDKLTGTMSWPDQKETELKDVKLKGADLTFSAVRQIMDNKYTVDYTLTIDKDKLKGKGAVEVGGEKREFDIDGKRAEKDKGGA